MRILCLQEGHALLLQPLLHLFRVHGLNINIYVVFLKRIKQHICRLPLAVQIADLAMAVL
jgi:hypothetical protein